MHLPALVIFAPIILTSLRSTPTWRRSRCGPAEPLTAAQQAMLLEQAHLLGIELQADGVELRLEQPPRSSATSC